MLERGYIVKYRKNVYKTLTLITQLGISMLVPTFLCVFLGSYLDERFGWKSFVPLMILGMAAGARNAFKLIKQSYDDEGDRRL